MYELSKWQVTENGHKWRVVATGPNYNHLPMGVGYVRISNLGHPFSSILSNIISPNIIHPWSEIGPICVCQSFGSPLRHSCVSGLGDDGEIPLLYLMSRGFLLAFLINILLNDFTIFYNGFYYGIILKFVFYSLWGFCVLPRVLHVRWVALSMWWMNKWTSSQNNTNATCFIQTILKMPLGRLIGQIQHWST